MAVKLSTSLRNHVLATGDFESGINGGVIRIYGGPSAAVPATADAAIQAGDLLLCTISNNAAGTGINMSGTAASGIIGKATAEVWKGLIALTGTALFFRFSPLSDAGGSSTIINRLQGQVAVVGQDLHFSSTAFVANTVNTKEIQSFNITQPTA